jgi:putative addiction module component (TIGR02574 family)
MPMSKDQIVKAAMELSAEDRQWLAEQLYQSVDDEPLSPEQIAELRRRADAIDRGDDKLTPAEEVLRRLRERARS